MPKKKTPYYFIIDIRDFSTYLCKTKTKVSEITACHRNTLTNMENKITHGCFIIICKEITDDKHR